MNNYAIATDGLATGLQDSASALKTAGNDFYEAAALVVAGNQVTQNPDSVGKGMRTISLRLTGTEYAKKELEDLGEDVSDFQIETQEKMQQMILDLTKTQTQAGVNILDANGNFRSTYEILLDIAKVWEQIAEEDKISGQNRQNALLEAMAGKNRANILASILESPDVLESSYKDALKSEGSAQQELNKHLDSIEGRLTKFRNTVQETIYNLLSSDDVKELISSGTEFIDDLGDALQGLTPILKTVLEVASPLIKVIGSLASAFGSLTPFLVAGGIITSKDKGRDKMLSLLNMPLVA